MRILSVSAQKPEATGSGIYLRETVRAFHELGHETAVLAGITAEDTVSFPPYVRFFPVLYESEALPFPVCGMSDEMPYRSTVYRTMTKEMTAQFRAAFGVALQRAAAEFQPDVLLCHHLYLLTAYVRELFPDIPVWGICHNTDLRQMYTHDLARQEICRGICALDRIFCLSDAQISAVCDCYGAEKSRISVVGNGYNHTLFYPRSAAPHREIRLAFAGKISEKKGVYSLLRAMRYLGDEYSLALAGGWNGEEQKAAAEAAMAEVSQSVRLLGPLPQEELAALFSESDVFVLPSFFDGMPLVLTEAMACGCHVVCTDLPGIRERMDALIPQHEITFVPLPRMLFTDSPDPTALPAFEKQLAQAIAAAAKLPKRTWDLRAVSWTRVVEKMLQI